MRGPEHNPTRRRLLLGFGLGTSAIALGGVKLGRHDGVEIIGRVIHRRLPNVTFEGDGLAAFGADFLRNDRTSTFKLKVLEELLILVESPLLRRVFPARVLALFNGFERRVITAVFHSTDYTGQAGPTTIRYLAINDPFTRLCANHLFRPAGYKPRPPPSA